jgi:hypothetical protein
MVRNRMPEDVEDRIRSNGHVPEVVGIRASEVITKPVEWLWDKRIPKGKLTMFDGDPDVGKSVITMDLAARVRPAGRSPMAHLVRPEMSSSSMWRMLPTTP